MARIRSVKPSLRTSRVVAQWRHEIRYFWVLLWGYLDDDGRGLDRARAIAADCYPLEDNITAAKVERWLKLIASTRRDPDRDPPLCRYQIHGERYLHAVYWDDNQRPARPTPSRIPPCPTHDGPNGRLTEPSPQPGSETLTERLSESPVSRQLLEGEGEEGKKGGGGRVTEPLTEPAAPAVAGHPHPPERSKSQDEDPGGLTRQRMLPEPRGVAEPPRRCHRHIDDPDPPNCGPCADARRRHEAWDAERAARIAAAPRCRTHRGQLVETCSGCAADRKAAADAPERQVPDPQTAARQQRP